MSPLYFPIKLILNFIKIAWSHFVGNTPYIKEWSLAFHFLVIFIRALLTSLMGLPLSTFRRINNILGFSKAIGCQTIQKVVPNKFRALSHEIVKNHSIDRFGSYYFDEDDKWENSSDLEIQWILPNYLIRSSNQKSFYYLHGGGFTINEPNTYSYLLGNIAKESECQVFSLNYRKAPEYTMIAIFEDLIAGYLYLTSDIKDGGLGINADNIVAGGDSAGGCMTAQLIHFLRDSSLNQVAGAFMWSPFLDFSCSQPSLYQNTHIDILPPHPDPPIFIDQNYSIKCFLDLIGYLGSGDKIRQKIIKNGSILGPTDVLRNSMYFPLGTKDLSNLPPILTMTGEVEILRDDAYLYCKSIFESNSRNQSLNSNIPSQTLQVYEGMPHGFMILPCSFGRSAALQRTANFLKLCLDADYQQYYQHTDTKIITKEINGSPQILSKDKFQAYRHSLKGEVEVFEPSYPIVEIPNLR